LYLRVYLPATAEAWVQLRVNPYGTVVEKVKLRLDFSTSTLGFPCQCDSYYVRSPLG